HSKDGASRTSDRQPSPPSRLPASAGPVLGWRNGTWASPNVSTTRANRQWTNKRSTPLPPTPAAPRPAGSAACGGGSASLCIQMRDRVMVQYLLLAVAHERESRPSLHCHCRMTIRAIMALVHGRYRPNRASDRHPRALRGCREVQRCYFCFVLTGTRRPI